jgi:hypothetical protein
MSQVVALGRGNQDGVGDALKLAGGPAVALGLALTSISHGTAGEAEAEADAPALPPEEPRTPHAPRPSSDAEKASTTLSRIRPPLLPLRLSRPKT